VNDCPNLDESGRAWVMRLIDPRRNKAIRKMVFERFGPREQLLIPTGEHPAFDEVL
jgi:hypothetical protein